MRSRISSGALNPKRVRGGPLLVINGVMTPINGLTKTGNWIIIITLFLGVITPFINSRGLPCVLFLQYFFVPSIATCPDGSFELSLQALRGGKEFRRRLLPPGVFSVGLLWLPCRSHTFWKGNWGTESWNCPPFFQKKLNGGELKRIESIFWGDFIGCIIHWREKKEVFIWIFNDIDFPHGWLWKDGCSFERQPIWIKNPDKQHPCVFFEFTQSRQAIILILIFVFGCQKRGRWTCAIEQREKSRRGCLFPKSKKNWKSSERHGFSFSLDLGAKYIFISGFC